MEMSPPKSLEETLVALKATGVKFTPKYKGDLLESLRQYNKEGRQTHYANRSGFYSMTDYDERGRVLFYRNSDGEFYIPHYDGDGCLTRFRDHEGVWNHVGVLRKQMVNGEFFEQNVYHCSEVSKYSLGVRKKRFSLEDVYKIETELGGVFKPNDVAQTVAAIEVANEMSKVKNLSWYNRIVYWLLSIFSR